MSDMTPQRLSSQASLGSSLSFSACLMRFSKSVRIFKHAHGRISIFILSMSERVELADVFHDLPRDADIPRRPSQIDIRSQLSQFCTSLWKTLTAKPLRCMAKGTNSHDTLIQLVLLVFCQCSLDQLSDFVDTTQHFYAQFRQMVTDPRRTVITNSSLREIITDAYFYEQLQDSISALTSATEPLLDLLHISFAAQPEFKSLATEMRATCADLTKSSTRLSTRLASHLHLFEQLRNFNNSLSVWLLALLASIFLPLSLASSLLSMQSRLADLHFLLYDFCGVIVLLGTIVLVIIILLRVYARLAEQLVKSKRNRGFRIWIYPFL
ncbi:hypothetical protein CC80DRAFT_448519 [Byssothecium circinans]|uniref:Uncharacterized protein n=1 Tax=Byssothecium circinans TaxID=147558 RepID=A0A6A5TVT5_9PLEO|nr:hypothetical protein CC80DRAFT_448519 [Byssothecium circinans]